MVHIPSCSVLMLKQKLVRGPFFRGPFSSWLQRNRFAGTFFLGDLFSRGPFFLPNFCGDLFSRDLNTGTFCVYTIINALVQYIHSFRQSLRQFKKLTLQRVFG